jgi:hypothetical protein
MQIRDRQSLNVRARRDKPPAAKKKEKQQQQLHRGATDVMLFLSPLERKKKCVIVSRCCYEMRFASPPREAAE